MDLYLLSLELRVRNHMTDPLGLDDLMDSQVFTARFIYMK